MKNKILSNVCWILINKVLIYVFQFIVGVKVANHFGSEEFGIYAVAISLIAFSNIFFEILNLSIVKVKIHELKENFNETVSLIGSFRSSVAMIIVIFIIIYGLFTNIDKKLYYLLLFLSINNLIYEYIRGIEIYFEYKLMSKYVAITNTVVRIVICLLQLLSIKLNFSILVLPVIKCIGSLIARYIIMKLYKLKIIFRFPINEIISLIKEGKYLWISFITLTVYSQIDKLMLAKLIDVRSVGIYSVALQLIIVLGILILPIQSSLYPSMIKNYENKKKYYAEYQSYNSMITWIYILLAIISNFIVKNFFHYIYSNQYNEAIDVFIVLSIGMIFKSNSALQNNHIIISKSTKYLLLKNILGVIINIVLNYILILKYGIIGAAISTAITQMITLFLIDFLIDEYRKHFYIQLKSFNVLNLKYLAEIKRK